MSIKNDLKELVEQTVIPEVEDYIDELHENLENNEQTGEDQEIIREMESFLVELQNILEVIKEDSLEEEQYQEVYDKLKKNIDEHSHEDEE